MNTHASTSIIAFPFVGDTVGGSHLSTLLLMKELSQFGFRPIALVHDDGPLTHYFTSNGVEFLQTGLPYFDFRKGGIMGLGCALAIAPKITTFLRRNNIALVHVNDGRMIASWTFPAILAKRPVVVHARQPWSKSRLTYACFQIANARIAISSYVHNSMPEKIRAKTTLISNPFQTTVIGQTKSRTHVTETVERPRRPVIAFIGTLMERKRPSVFLAAAAEISQFMNAEFVLLGRETPILPALKKQVTELGLEGLVTFAGFRDDVNTLLPGYDLLIAPAVNEAHGRVLVEAMLSRVPVIAANSGGHKEIVQDRKTGLLVAPDNPTAFSSAVDLLFNETGFRDKIVENAWLWASSAFSARHHASQVVQIYRNLLKAP